MNLRENAGITNGQENMDGRRILDLTPEEQGKFYSALFASIVKKSGRIPFTRESRWHVRYKKGDAIKSFQQFFGFTEHIRDQVGAGGMAVDFQRLLQLLNESFQPDIVNPYSKKDIGDTALLLSPIFEAEGDPVEYIQSLQKRHKQARDFLGLERILISKFKAYFKQNESKMRNEFKIHFNPKPEYLPLIMKTFCELLAEQPELADDLLGFKVACERGLKAEEVSDHTQPVPNFVVYIKSAEDASKTAQRTVRLLRAINDKFKTLDPDIALPLDDMARYNYPISSLLSVAQGSGDFKQIAVNLKDPDSTKRLYHGGNVAALFYDQATNYAFSPHESGVIVNGTTDFRDESAKLWSGVMDIANL